MVEIDERVRPVHDSEKKEGSGASLDGKRWIKGQNGKDYIVEKELEVEEVRKQLQAVKNDPDVTFTSVAIVLMHSYAFSDHEEKVG